jgi:hypothetical protein
MKHFEYDRFHIIQRFSIKLYFKIAIPFSISAEDMRQYHVRFLFKQRHSNDSKFLYLLKKNLQDMFF